jgi:hypothetical protein
LFDAGKLLKSFLAVEAEDSSQELAIRISQKFHKNLTMSTKI